MSYVTFLSRRLLGDERHEEAKGAVLGSGAAAVISALPADKGDAPRAIVDHRLTLNDSQKMLVGAAIFLTAFYIFFRRGK